MGEADAQMLKTAPEYTLSDYYLGVPTELIEIDVALKDGDTITLGNTTVYAIHTPGHSKGAMTYQFEVTDGVDTYTALLCGGTGFNSLNKDFMRETGENWPAFTADLEKRYRKMIEEEEHVL